MLNIKNLVLGRPLKSSELGNEKLSRLWGLPIMASDAVSSVAYAGQEILLVLVPAAGLMAMKFMPLVVLPILLLLLILAISYSQIIDQYPNGGGAYVVSKGNLGEGPAMLAAASLIVDYLLTVAVSISSSTEAVAAAFPAITNYKVEFSLVCVALITLGNLRGLRESSKLFGMPTYIFVGSMAIMIITGFIRIATGSLHPIAYTQAQLAPLLPQSTVEGIGLLVLLRAFSSGCSALTGVEAVSNAIPSFTEPSQKHAKQILFMLAGVIFFIFGGSSILILQLHALPVGNATVISELANAVFGHSFMFFIVQVFTALILLLAANTSYNGLPLLLSILAHDGYVPRQFSHRGTKLSFSNGIVFIFIVSALLIIQFHSDTHKLIPLYSVGVFISFTLSQFGMFIRWRKTHVRGWKVKSVINLTGAVVTFVTLIVVFLNKFMEGAWMIAITIPILIAFMYYIRRHYLAVMKELDLKQFYPYYDKSASHSTQCIVLVQSINKSLLKSLNYANSIADDVTALHICRHPEHAEELRQQWEALSIPIHLEIIETPYRDIIGPLDQYISEREKKLGHGDTLSLIIIKFLTEHWYDTILHNQTTYFIERVVSRHKSVASIILPFHYREFRRKEQKTQ